MSDLLDKLPNERPDPTAADAAYWNEALAPCGPSRSGVVVSVSCETGTGYVREDGDDLVLSPMSRLGVGAVFDALSEGTRVIYAVNSHGVVVSLERE